MNNLAHYINGDVKLLYKILTDGFLKSSSKTKNVKLYGSEKGTPYIFVLIEKIERLSGITLILDEKLLLEHNFYLHIEWKAGIVKNEKKYIGKELSSSELSKILNKFIKDTQKNIQRLKKEHYPSFSVMTHEILVKNNISLKKYLLEIKISKEDIDKNPKLLDYIKINYPNVKLTFM
jgi:hypothetical protein